MSSGRCCPHLPAESAVSGRDVGGIVGGFLTSTVTFLPSQTGPSSQGRESADSIVGVQGVSPVSCGRRIVPVAATPSGSRGREFLLS